ncbi:hypothetical protein EON67_09755 [archaeon]|nr:MAG: hypothetical protein EON67_09755 [archaeon]
MLSCGAEERVQLIAEALDGPSVRAYCDMAREHKMWLSLGGFPEALLESEVVEGGPRAANTHIIIADDGRIVASYRKVRNAWHVCAQTMQCTRLLP